MMRQRQERIHLFRLDGAELLAAAVHRLRAGRGWVWKKPHTVVVLAPWARQDCVAQEAGA
jgi:hypothetical protein